MPCLRVCRRRVDQRAGVALEMRRLLTGRRGPPLGMLDSRRMLRRRRRRVRCRRRHRSGRDRRSCLC